MTTILCFGDSNTWGYAPDDGRRYNSNERWPGRLAKLLPTNCKVIEQGAPGRTTFFADPSAGFSRGDKDLLTTIAQQNPDYIVLMLGTNDLKASFAQSGEDIAANVGKLVTSINNQSTATVIVVAPPVIHEVGNFGTLFVGATEKSKTFSKYYALRMKQLNCEFFDASQIVTSSTIDGIHWDVQQHSNMATAIAVKLKQLLSATSK